MTRSDILFIFFFIFFFFLPIFGIVAVNLELFGPAEVWVNGRYEFAPVYLFLFFGPLPLVALFLTIRNALVERTHKDR